MVRTIVLLNREIIQTMVLLANLQSPLVQQSSEWPHILGWEPEGFAG